MLWNALCHPETTDHHRRTGIRIKLSWFIRSMLFPCSRSQSSVSRSAVEAERARARIQWRGQEISANPYVFPRGLHSHGMVWSLGRSNSIPVLRRVYWFLSLILPRLSHYFYVFLNLGRAISINYSAPFLPAKKSKIETSICTRSYVYFVISQILIERSRKIQIPQFACPQCKFF